MTESDLQRDYNYPINFRDSKIFPDKLFVYINIGSMGGTHWVFFDMKANKTYYFDSFGGVSDIDLFIQLPNQKNSHNYRIQDKSSRFCGSFCFYFFYLIERMNYYDTI